MLNNVNVIKRKIDVLTRAIELFPHGIAIYKKSGVLFYANCNYFNINHLNPSDIDNIHFNKISKCLYKFEDVLKNIYDKNEFVLQKELNGSWYESTFYLHDNDFIIQIYKDITSKKQDELSLKQMAFFFENSSDGMMICNAKGYIIKTNNAFTNITGYTQEEALGKNAIILKSDVHDSDFFANMQKSLKESGFWRGEIWNKNKDGKICPHLLSVSKIIDSKYKEAYYLSVFSDLTNIKELFYHANHDLLTGLANRTQLEAFLKNSIANAKRNNKAFGLFYIDLDKFKSINDTYGHDIGDEVLKESVKRIKQTIREDDFFARVGGDEFILVLRDISSSHTLLKVAQKISQVFNEPIRIDKHILSMSISMGIAIYPQDATDISELIKKADIAMYRAKNHQKSSFSFINDHYTL